MATLQQLPDLASLEGLSPYLNQAGMGQIQMANQFNQTGLEANQADLKAKTLANLLTEQTMPLDVEAKRLANEGTGFTNMKLGVEGRNAVALEPEAREAKRKELLKKATDDELQKLLSDAQLDSLSGDPARMKRGENKRAASWAEIERRQKQADAVALENLKGDKARDVANIHAGATLGAARINADARKAAASAKSGATSDIDALVDTGKVPPARAAVALYNRAMKEQDPEVRTELISRAQIYERLAQTTAPAAQGQEGKVDIKQYQVPTRNAPSAIGAAPQAPRTINKLPEGAKQIGTSGGKPVYQTPDGKRFIGE